MLDGNSYEKCCKNTIGFLLVLMHAFYETPHKKSAERWDLKKNETRTNLICLTRESAISRTFLASAFP